MDDDAQLLNNSMKSTNNNVIYRKLDYIDTVITVPFRVRFRRCGKIHTSYSQHTPACPIQLTVDERHTANVPARKWKSAVETFRIHIASAVYII